MSKTNSEVSKEERDHIIIDEEKLYVDEMDDTQKVLVVHLKDLTDKVANAEYALTQLQFARQAFVNALKESITADIPDE